MVPTGLAGRSGSQHPPDRTYRSPAHGLRPSRHWPSYFELPSALDEFLLLRRHNN